MIITPRLLERKDIFTMWGSPVVYRVQKIESGRVFFQSYTNNAYGNKHSIGVNSREKVTLIKDGDFRCPPNELKNHMKILVPEEEEYIVLCG